MIRTFCSALLLVAVGSQSAGAADSTNGVEVFKKCAACHTAEEGGPNRVGPNLHGLFGRAAGSVSDYAYSDAMRNSGVVWSAETLMQYLGDPKAFVPGNKMPFPGLKNEVEREDLIAYLKQVTGEALIDESQSE